MYDILLMKIFYALKQLLEVKTRLFLRVVVTKLTNWVQELVTFDVLHDAVLLSHGLRVIIIDHFYNIVVIEFLKQLEFLLSCLLDLLVVRSSDLAGERRNNSFILLEEALVDIGVHTLAKFLTQSIFRVKSEFFEVFNLRR